MLAGSESPPRKQLTGKSFLTETESSTSPTKSKNPMNSIRKSKLNAFLTGSSNASSQRGSLTGDNNNFFTFKDKDISY